MSSTSSSSVYGQVVRISRASMRAQFDHRPYHQHDVVRRARQELEQHVARHYPGYTVERVRLLDVEDKGEHYEVGFIYSLRWKGHIG